MKPQVAVSGAFDDTSSRTVRFLQEAARFGDLTALVLSDEAVTQATGKQPKFPQAERLYFLRALRYVKQALGVDRPPSSPSPHLRNNPSNPDSRMGSPNLPNHDSSPSPPLGERAGVRGIDGPSTTADVKNSLPSVPNFQPDLWIVDEPAANPAQQTFCTQHRIQYRILSVAQLQGFPAAEAPLPRPDSPRKKVIVTGSFDWFHSGHVRFFEEVSALGDLYAIVGHDANIRLLKGEGHPLFSQDERLYLVQSIRYVTQAMISTGKGWLDAEPEIIRLKPDIYAVNEDGDKGGKREYCQQHGIQYVVLQRIPAAGLPGRSSTQLRGF